MRRFGAFLTLVLLLALGLPGMAASGRVIKVLPFFLDLKGRHTLTPSLYERDAYQSYLRENPAKRSGMLFDVQWKTKGTASAPLKIKLELRGIVEGKAPRQLVLEAPAEKGGLLGSWTEIKLTGQKYTDFGEVTSWRATLWEGDTLLGEERSFLW